MKSGKVKKNKIFEGILTNDDTFELKWIIHFDAVRSATTQRLYTVQFH
jgi:hypothetical protein